MVSASLAGEDALAARSTASASETAPEDAAAMHYVGESIEEFDPAMVQAEKRTQADWASSSSRRPATVVVIVDPRGGVSS